MSEEFNTLVLEPPEVARKRDARQKPKRKDAPKYQVILWNDEDHTYEYVQMMMLELFGFSVEQGFVVAWKVDKTGKAVLLTTSREHAELKVEQIHAYGKDPLMPHCQGSMSATIEQVDA